MDPTLQQPLLYVKKTKGRQQQIAVIERPPTTVTDNQSVEQYREQIVFEATCDRQRYKRDIWLNLIVFPFIPVIGWIALLVFLVLTFCEIEKNVNTWYLYLTRFHINYSGFGDIWRTRTRRIPLSDILSVEANQPIGCDCWPPVVGYCYIPSSRNNVVVWLKPDKRSADGFQCRPDRVEIRYVHNPVEFVAAVQRQINALPQPTQ